MIIKKLQEIVEHNKAEIQEVNGDQNEANNLFCIEHGGISIWDFFHDESLIDDVNPMDYYGEEKLLSIIDEFIKLGG